MIKTSAKTNPQFFYFSLMVLFFATAVLLGKQGPPRLNASNMMREIPFIPIHAVPDFASIENVDVRKQTFFDFLQPYIDAENALILTQREALQELQGKVRENIPLSRRELAFVSTIGEQYEVETLEPFTQDHLRLILRRVDIIPSSLVLAQAANESAWGTSRFAVDGNNYFGQWCYSEGCGLVPSRRGADATHEVKAFDNAARSVHAYFMNLNTFPSYQKLRRIRQQLRERGQDIDGLSLAEGLDSYSERGKAYIEELRSMINYNDLGERDEDLRQWPDSV